MTISKEILDELLKGGARPEDLLGEAGLIEELKIKLMERMLGAEFTAHLGYEEGRDAPPEHSNRFNGTASKHLKGQDGEAPISMPRDRDGSFEPALIKKGQARIDGMGDKIIGLSAACLTVRDIRAPREDVYGLQVSPDLISRIAGAVLDEGPGLAIEVFIITGPGTTLGGAVAQSLIAAHWQGLDGKAAFQIRQAEDPLFCRWAAPISGMS